MGITDSDGYLFFNKNQDIIAEQSIAGERWRTYQKYLIANAPYLFEKLKAAGKTLVWIMEERRMYSGNAQEKFGKFGADRIKSYVGYFNGKEFTVREIYSEIWSSISEKKLL